MANDLKLAFDTLTAKKLNYDRYYAYYDGNQPLTYTSKRLEQIFQNLDAYFAENWCAVVIDAVRDRINLREIQVADAGKKKLLDEVWFGSELALESDEAHEAAMVTGEAYLIAWPDETERPSAYFNDPRLCHVFYQPEYPRIKRYAAKWWVAEDETLRMTLYYADRLEYYASKQKASNVSSTSSLVLAETAENPFNTIPVFHFRTGQRCTRSELTNVLPIQNGINKLLTDMMVTAEYLAFPQRYIISNADVQGKVRNAPNEILDLPAGDGIGQQTQAGQFPAADLENYLKAIDNMATALSSITRTPKHYFFSVGSNLSGEALIAMEAPLNKKAQDRIDRFTPVWQQIGAFMLTLAGMETQPIEVAPVFDKPETIQPRTRAETREINVRAGMPLVTILREEGWSDSRIQQMLDDQAALRARQTDELAKALLETERKMNTGGAA